MSEIDKDVERTQVSPQRRRLLKSIGAGARHGGNLWRGAVLPGRGNTIMCGRRRRRRSRWSSASPWTRSGQYAASGMDERLGAMMAIKEINAKGGVLGRPIEAIHMDSETTPATGSRVAERLITRNDVAYLVGALHSGRRQCHFAGRAEVRLHLPQHQFEFADRGRARTATASSSSGTAMARTSRWQSSRTRWPSTARTGCC